MKWFRRKTNPEVLSPLEGYNKWASSYRNESNPVKALSDELVIKYLPDLQGKSILDCGCGTGKFCSIAEQQSAASVVGIDLSPAMIDIASKENKKTNFICGDITGIDLAPDTFDVVVSALMMAHLESITAPLQKLLQSVKTGGHIIITDFHPFLTMLQAKRTFQDPASGRHYEVRHYLHLFEEYFALFGAHGFSVENFEEPRFNNTPAVFGIKARKVQ